MNNGSDGSRHLPSLFWILLIPAIGALAWLGLILAVGTTSPFEVTQGRSMEPLLHTGDLAIMRGVSPSQLRLGDVIAIRVSRGDRDQYNYPERVLHRVVDITLRDGSLVVRTKGDNEPEPDPFVTPASQITRRLDSSVPLLGYALFYLRSPQGRIALAGLVVLFVLYEGVRWMTDTAEELIEEPAPTEDFGTGLGQLAGAISEYGEHLRSHTRVVRELGGTTEELHEATALQREVLTDLSGAVRSLANRVGEPGWLPPAPALPPAAPPVAPVRADMRMNAAREPAASAHPWPSDASLLELVAFHRGELVLQLSEQIPNAEVLAIGAALETLPGVIDVALVLNGAAYFTIALAQRQGSPGLIEHLATLGRRASD